MQYCEKHELVIDPLHERCPLCEAEEAATEIGVLQAERDKYKAFVEKLARTKLVLYKHKCGLPHVTCPCCLSLAKREGYSFRHAGDCPVVEARRLLGMATDERGNLVKS